MTGALVHATIAGMKIHSTNVAVSHPDPSGKHEYTGIDKHPAPWIDVAAPGPNHGDGSGVAGDIIGDSKHHGGAHKAVYAYAREELDFWEGELGRELHSGIFGENLTVTGVDLAGLLIGQRMRAGAAVLEVSVPRQPCATFAGWIGEPGWLKRWTARGDCGAYLRVVEPGRIAAGDAVELLGRPDHEVTMGEAFRATMGNMDCARRVVASGCLPQIYHEPMARRVARARR